MTESHAATPEDPRLRSLPVQCIDLPDGLLLVRGCSEFKISGEGAAEAVQLVLAAAAGEGKTRQELLNYFGAIDRPGAEELLRILEARRVLVPGDAYPPPGANGESTQEVFYWEFGERADQVADRLGAQRIAILGVNGISQQLAHALLQCGFERVEVVDYPLLRNQRLFPEDDPEAGEWTGPTPSPFAEWEPRQEEGIDCLVATADFSGQQVMRHWNALCVERGRTFLPVMLDRGIGFVGPLVVPGETACYECLRTRENANLKEPELRRASENLAAVVRRPHLHGFLQPMASILGDIAAMELTKFYGGALPMKAGTLLEVNLIRPELRDRKVLKAPRCRVCGPLERRTAIDLNELSFLPGEHLSRPMSQ